MHAGLVFIGDELSAAGYRLAGLATRVPAPGEERTALDEACARAELVLIAARTAQAVPSEALAARLRAPRPIVMVVPELDGTPPLSDAARRARELLGIEK